MEEHIFGHTRADRDLHSYLNRHAHMSIYLPTQRGGLRGFTKNLLTTVLSSILPNSAVIQQGNPKDGGVLREEGWKSS